MNSIIDITGLSDAEIDRLLGVDPFVAFADAVAERFIEQWADMWACAQMASADEAFALEREGERVTSQWVLDNALAVFDASVRKACGLHVGGNNWMRGGW